MSQKGVDDAEARKALPPINLTLTPNYAVFPKTGNDKDDYARYDAYVKEWVHERDLHFLKKHLQQGEFLICLFFTGNAPEHSHVVLQTGCWNDIVQS